jgi:hypothetical protein
MAMKSPSFRPLQVGTNGDIEAAFALLALPTRPAVAGGSRPAAWDRVEPLLELPLR